MKTNRVLSIALILALVFSLTACFKPDVDVAGLWEQATYTTDTTVGKGATTVEVEFVIENQSVTITLKTDKTTLGEALYEHGLINAPNFITTANGITANWDNHQAWWKLCKSGEMTSVGAHELLLADGDHYEIVYMIGF